MSSHNLNETERGALEYPLVITATCTLTGKQLLTYATFVVSTTDTVVVTLPVPDAYMAGMSKAIANGSTGTTTIVCAGFGGGAGVTLTIAQGDSAIVWCDGSYWYSVHHTTPA